MRVTSLFTGVGGFELAFQRVGIPTQLMVELDPFARRVLEARFPHATIMEDVLSLSELPKDTDVLTAGFPCQNLSMAGDKSGIEGAKSSVVTKLFELISRADVPTVIIENVYFMLHLDGGNAMAWMVNQFERLGYAWAYRVVDSLSFGLPQRRRRVYFVASRDRDPRGVLFADDSAPAPEVELNLDMPIGFYWTEGRSGIGLTADAIPPLKVGSGLGIPSAPAVLFPDGEVLMPSLSACEQLQGFPQHWSVDSDSSDGARTSRWRLIGNAVSVPVAEWVARRTVSPGEPREFLGVQRPSKRMWHDAAWNVGDGKVSVEAGDRPLGVLPPSISSFRNESWTRLSDRALNGFIARACEGGLKVPDGFLDALRRAPRKDARPVF